MSNKSRMKQEGSDQRSLFEPLWFELRGGECVLIYFKCIYFKRIFDGHYFVIYLDLQACCVWTTFLMRYSKCLFVGYPQSVPELTVTVNRCRPTPISFFLFNCEEKDVIVTLIEFGGGKVVDVVDDDTISLAPVGFVDYGSEYTVFGIDYITSCCVANTILRYDEFVFSTQYNYTSTFNEDYLALSNEILALINAEKSLVTTIIDSPSHGRRTELQSLSKRVLDPTSSDEDCSPVTKKRNPGSSFGANRQTTSAHLPAMPTIILSSSSDEETDIHHRIPTRTTATRTWTQYWSSRIHDPIKTTDSQTISEDEEESVQTIGVPVDKRESAQTLSEDEEESVQTISVDKEESVQTISVDKVESAQTFSEDEEENVQTMGVDKGESAQTLGEHEEDSVQTMGVDKGESAQTLSEDEEESVQTMGKDEGESIQTETSTTLCTTPRPTITRTTSPVHSLADYGEEAPPSSTSTHCSLTAAPMQPKPRKMKVNTRKARKQKMDELLGGLSLANLSISDVSASNKITSYRPEGFAISSINWAPQLGESETMSSGEKKQATFNMGERVCDRAFWRSISPTLKSPPQDMVSSLCPQCCKCTVYSLTCFHDQDKTIAYCKTCSTPDCPVLLVMLFWLTVELDAWNRIHKLIIAGNDARYFFGCTETEYLSCEETRARSQRDLRRVLARKKNRTWFKCSIMPFTNPNFDSRFSMTRCRLKTIASELALL